MKRKTIYLKTQNLNPIAELPKNFRVEIWRPTLIKLRPPGKPIKYSFLSLAYILNILPNRNFFQIKVFDQSNLVSSLLVVPKIYKFPYMKKKDIQFIYVMTNANYRGKSIAAATILESKHYLKERVDSYWYVTSEDNVSSLKLAKKLGFKNVKKLK